MKILKYSLALALSLGLFSCYNDNSTEMDYSLNDFQKITVQSAEADSTYYYQGDEIKITPSATSEAPSEITYTWSVGEYNGDNTIYTDFSTEKDLDIVASAIGHYSYRFVATNEYGSTIKYYDVFVNTAFEEGFMVLTRSTDGNTEISFMRTLTPDEEAAGDTKEFIHNAFNTVNPEKSLGSNIIDIAKSNGYIYILNAEPGKAEVEVVDAKTFQNEMTYGLWTIFPDFDPVRLNCYDLSSSISNFYVHSRNGGCAWLIPAQLDAFEFVEYPADAKIEWVDFRYSYNTSSYYAMSSDGLLYYWGFTYVGTSLTKATGNVDYFQNRDIIAHFIDESTYYGQWGAFICINKDGDKTVLSKLYAIGKIPGADPMVTAVDTDRELTENLDKITTETLFHHQDNEICVFFNEGNDIYKWFYTQNEIPSTPVFSLPEGEEIKQITSMPYESGDETELHIYTNNPSRGEMSGSLYIYDVATLTVKEKYEGAFAEPIKGMYKTKD